jgi:hypothetical protein
VTPPPSSSSSSLDASSDRTASQSQVLLCPFFHLLVDPVTGLTWQLIAETCGAEEVTLLRRSARLNQPREIEEDIYSEPEPEDDHIDEEEIEFESDQEDVVTAGYEAEEGAGTSDD